MKRQIGKNLNRVCLAGMTIILIGCGGKSPAPEMENTIGIGELGTTDLKYDATPLPNPAHGLPALENVDPSVTPALASQELPEETVEIHELDKVASYVGLSEDDLSDILRESGVARQQTAVSRELMAQSLSSVAGDSDEPGILVTSDALFNTFHNFFDNLLLGAEVGTLRPNGLALLQALKHSAAQRYNSLEDGDTRKAALEVVEYLQVAHSLMDPHAEMIVEVQDVVDAEREAIMAHAGMGPSPVLDRADYSQGLCQTCNPCEEGCGLWEGEEFVPCPERYCEDYTQYVPRGHYTYNEDLENYFRSLMWLGRLTFLNRSDQSTRGAVVLVDSLKSTTVEIDDQMVPAVDVWRQFFRVVGTFVGGMDDLNASEIDGAIIGAMGDGFSLQDLDDAANVALIQEGVGELRDPEILSGFLSSQAHMSRETKGLRLLGQVFLPDSYAFGKVIFDAVGANDEAEGWEASAVECDLSTATDPESLSDAETACVCDKAFDNGFWDVCRGLPSGLDVAAIMDNSRAKEEAQEQFGGYAHYSEKLSEMVAEFSGFDLEDWGTSLAWTWLYAIKGLTADADEGDPAFMRTDAWADKSNETGLTSWAQMRHDTILYAKQSYTPGSDADTDADTDTDIDYVFDYLEPQPEAYSRLAAAARRLGTLASSEDLFNDDAETLSEELSAFVEMMERATAISVKELEGEALMADDVSWIRSTGWRVGSLENKLLESLDLIGEDQEPDPDRLKTTVIADVHTWAEKEVVLEVGSGHLEYIVVLHQLPEGQWGVAVGPAFSYHEFEQPMANRLTDEEWREILIGDPYYGCPDWLAD